LADAIFSLSFAAPLGSIAEFICRQGWTLDSVPQTRLLSEADAPPSSLTDVAYADDDLLLAALRDHTDVRRQATALAETIHISMRSFGYDPNYKRHKSGIMVAFTGRGHRPACTRFHSGGDVIHSERWQFSSSHRTRLPVLGQCDGPLLFVFTTSQPLAGQTLRRLPPYTFGSP
jgi:hypothetical protein